MIPKHIKISLTRKVSYKKDHPVNFIFSNIISGQQTDIGVLTDFTRPTSGVRIIEFESEIANQTYDVELWDCSGDLEQGKWE